MTMISHYDKALTQRNSMFNVAVKAGGRHGYGLAFNTVHMHPVTREPVGWLREQLDHILLTWTTDDDTFPEIIFNQGIPINEVWPTRDDQIITWQDAVHSAKGLGRFNRLYIGGDE